MSIERVRAALIELGIQETFLDSELKILADRGLDSTRRLRYVTREMLEGLRMGRIDLILECTGTRLIQP